MVRIPEDRFSHDAARIYMDMLLFQLPVVQGILDVTKDRPWLWAVFLVVIVLPVVLVIAYCCFGSKQEVTQILSMVNWLYRTGRLLLEKH